MGMTPVNELSPRNNRNTIAITLRSRMADLATTSHREFSRVVRAAGHLRCVGEVSGRLGSFICLRRSSQSCSVWSA